MSYNMMEAYQVKMAQLADEFNKVPCPQEPTRRLAAETWVWIRRQFGQAPRTTPVAHKPTA